ncbi:MAG TPA: lipopolysaccharide transport periplasmic protein LptA [Dokdonella sp.]
MPRGSADAARPLRGVARAALAGALLAAAAAAHALSTDRNQVMTIDSDYSKLVQASDDKPGVAYLNGNVQIVQGSMKSHGDEATIYQHATGAKDAQGNDVGGSVQRVVLIGKKAQAHMQQLQDNDAGLITADADKIDYNNDSGIAELTGNVVVVQECRGTFHGTHMTYNTNTGEMESGDHTPTNRVHLVMQPGGNTKPAEPGAQPACVTTKADAAKPAAAAPKPAAAKPTKTKPAAQPGGKAAAGGGAH